MTDLLRDLILLDSKGNPLYFLGQNHVFSLCSFLVACIYSLGLCLKDMCEIIR
jgi:hypothetical protein